MFSEYRISSLIQETAKSGPITREQDRNKYNRLKGIWPTLSGNELYKKITETLQRIVSNKSIAHYEVELYKVELWIQGFTDQVSSDFITELFLSSKISDTQRCVILYNSEIPKIVELLKLFMQTHEWKYTFDLIISYHGHGKYDNHITALDEIKLEVIRNSPNEILNNITSLKSFLSSTPITTELSNILREKLVLGKYKVWGSSLISNFEYLKTHKIIDSENHLLNLLVGEDLYLFSLTKLGSLITSTDYLSTFRDIIKNNSVLFSTEDKINIMKAFAHKIEFVEILINEYKTAECIDFPPDILSILDSFRQSKIKEKEEERQRKIKDEEFESLVAEIGSKGFTMSAQVSNYIINHRLGDKYKHISGILEMENNGTSWKFNGGFPTDVYARLCQRLRLKSKGTNSRVVGFTAFKDL